jgi:hypothetical protein
MLFFSFFASCGRRPANRRRSDGSPSRLTLEHLEARNAPSALSGMGALSDYQAAIGQVREMDSTNSIQIDWGQSDDQGEGEHQRGRDDGQATITTTTQFTTIASGVFIDLPASSFLTPVTAGTVTITASNDADGSFFNFTPGTPDAPGSGDGFLDFNHDAFNVSPLVLNFSTPVAAFGVSFMQMSPTIEGGNFSSPAVLKVYDGANGTGNLLGSVTSSGFVPTTNPNGHQSFVAIESSVANIRSAVLVGTGPNLGFAVDGYAVSVTPQGGGTGGGGH